MSDAQSRLQYLFQRYLDEVATPDEIQEFWDLFSRPENQELVSGDLWRLWDRLGADGPSRQKDWKGVTESIHSQIDAWELGVDPGRKGRFSSWYPIAATAAILIVSALALTLFHRRAADPVVRDSPAKVAAASDDIRPGSSQAVLTLSNGSEIVLDSTRGGQLARQGSTGIYKTGQGAVAYRLRTTGKDVGAVPVFNTLRTPRGGQYQLVLADGTKVWLNDSSSIRFPAAFTGATRTVSITGEVYFEVAQDPGHPFQVEKGDMLIEVVGTSFNVNAYEDEDAVEVTLLQGAVRVSEPEGHLSRIIRPGQQLRIDRQGKTTLVSGVNLSQVIAWKNNLFWFEDDDIQTIMRQVSRWYNVNVEIQGKISEHFTGSIPRNIMVSGVFEVLRRTGNIEFSIQDKTIYVSP